jgi:hypothetical protein
MGDPRDKQARRNKCNSGYQERGDGFGSPRDAQDYASNKSYSLLASQDPLTETLPWRELDHELARQVIVSHSIVNFSIYILYMEKLWNTSDWVSLH